MLMTPRNLAKKRDKLKASAEAATTLAASERLLADQQHAAASELEDLADDLGELVTNIEAEMLKATVAV